MTSSWASSETARRTMVANRRRDTKPEMHVRKILHARGLRYLVDARPIPALRSHADIVFSRRRIAVYIDGCFWHQCPVHATSPRANAEYWGPKLNRNRERDLAANSALKAAGWSVLRFWEHEDPSNVAETIIHSWRTAFVSQDSPITAGPAVGIETDANQHHLN